MVEVIIGDLFSSPAQTLVNTVNCVGVMGKGVALEFKKRFPEMYEDYLQRCGSGQVRLGEPYLYRNLLPPWVLNFPTKDHWRSVSQLSSIVQGLEYLEEHYREWGIESLAVPPLGCGNGQLEWSVVGPTLYRHLQKLDIPVQLYAPYGTPHEELQPVFLGCAEGEKVRNGGPVPVRHVDPAWVALVEILARIESEPYHWPVGRVSLQKIAYFATECGIPTGLHYRRGSFGPYAANLKTLIGKLMNNSIITEERLGQMFVAKVGPTFKDAQEAYADALRAWHDSIEKITDLFLRMKTTQAELAATVHFAAKSLTKSEQERPTEKEVLNEVLTWKKKRRPPLNESDVAHAIRHLNVLCWIDVRPSADLPVSDELFTDD